MLLYFKTSNHLSFDDEVSFSTVAGNFKVKNPITKEKTDELAENLIHIDKYDVDVLRTSVIYGANASGKSNLLIAIFNSNSFIHDNFSNSNSDAFINEYFMNFYNQNREINLKRPLSVTFGILIDDVQFEYSFSLDEKRILNEILYEYRSQKPIEHFSRKFNPEHNEYIWDFSKYFLGQKEAVKNITNEHSLYLTVGSTSKLPICEKVFKWFHENLMVSIDHDFPGSVNDDFTLHSMYHSKAVKDFVLEQLKIADFNIVDIQVKIEGDEIISATSIHQTIDNNGVEVKSEFNYLNQESLGTRRFVGWLGYFIGLVSNNRVLIIDEFGVSMHSLLTKHLLNAVNWNFEDGVKNKAQLIFTTHDTNLMTRELFRPDQIWIMEKDDCGNSKLYSMSQFKLLKGQDLETTYLQGLYGGIPHFKENRDE